MNRKCLNEEEIADFMEDRLPHEARLRVERHLSECDACLKEVVVVRGVVRGGHLADYDPVPDVVTRKAIEMVQERGRESLSEKASGLSEMISSKWNQLRRSLWPLYNFQLAAVRGTKTFVSDDLVIVKKSFPTFDAEIEIEKTADDEACIQVKVNEKSGNIPIRVSLFKNEREMSSYLLNDSKALFDDIPFSHYRLTFTRDGSKIGEYPFEIKESHYGRRRQ